MNNSKVIIACDFESKDKLYSFLDNFKDEKPFLKLGMQIIYKEGFEIIKDLKDKGHKIFLDLKLHDIPVTVYKGLKSLVDYNVDFITIHSSGGSEMLKMAQEAVEGSSTKLLAVTVLTSLDEKNLREMNVEVSVSKQVETLMEMTSNGSIYGVVCSPFEANIASKYGLAAVTPGIRLESNSKDDQKRIATPEWAVNNGASFIVVGRSITNSDNPLETYQMINERIQNETNS